VILLGLEKEQRCLVEMDLGVRRALEILGEVVPWLLDADRAAADLDAEVGACELRGFSLTAALNAPGWRLRSQLVMNPP
jgi:hypothetical protein